jgi:hypothetical protein
MLINVRGICGAGKSWAVKGVLKKISATPLFGLLGPRMPEAYRGHTRHGEDIYVLGPYEGSATGGADYITKKGVTATVGVLEKYVQLGHVILESVLISTRFLEPSVGAWFLQHKKDVLHVTLDTPYDACLQAVLERQQRSIVEGTPPKHIERQWIDFGRVTKRLTELKFRMEYVSREDAVEKIVAWLENVDVPAD